MVLVVLCFVIGVVLGCASLRFCVGWCLGLGLWWLAWVVLSGWVYLWVLIVFYGDC